MQNPDNNRKSFLSVAVGIALGLLLAWWLGLFASGTPAMQTAVAPTPPPASPAKPILVTTVAHTNVAMPTAPAVAAHQSDVPPTTASSSPKKTGAAATIQPDGVAQVRTQSRLKAVTNNLRILASAAQTYMMDKGVTYSNYYDIVGTGTDMYVHGITPVVDEDYTDLTFVTSQSQVTLSSASLGTITYAF